MEEPMSAISDKNKFWIAIACFTAMLILPVAAFMVGWIGWDIKKGALAAVAVFLTFFICGCGILLLIKKIPAPVACMPFVIGYIYAVLPIPIPGPMDNTGVALIGALLSYVLWLRRTPATPRWIVIPMLFAAAYNMIGWMIPGPFDEFFIYLFCTAVAGFFIFILPKSKQTADVEKAATEGKETTPAAQESEIATALNRIQEPEEQSVLYL
jgi:hypothetical protein